MTQDNGVEELVQRIAREYDDLSRQLKVIAHYITHNRQQMVVVRILDVARACDVQPSAVVRFAQRFGFSGFSELQAVFRDAYASGTTGVGYQQRIQAVRHGRHCDRVKLRRDRRVQVGQCRGVIQQRDAREKARKLRSEPLAFALERS